MVFDPESAVHLKPWLVRTLEPICDAEPGALADYILALLKHNVPENEMRQELAVQLDEFLEKECNSFIDTLFTVIRTKSYLPYQVAPEAQSFSDKPLDTGIPIPLDALLTASSISPDRTRKRSTTDDERDGRPPAKGPRLNNDAQFSRYGGANGGDGRMGPHSSGGWARTPFRDVSMGMGMGMGMGPYGGQIPGMMNGMGMMNGRRPQGYQPPDQKRGLCRDYHQNGYCARGPTCKYSHADDAVLPGQLYPGNGMPFMPMFPANSGGMPYMQGATYDPNEARMDMRPMNGRQNQRAPLLPRIRQEDGSRVVHPTNASGELPVIQDLTPVVAEETPADESQPQSDVDMQQPAPYVSGPVPNPPHMPGAPHMMHHNNMNGNGYQPGPAMEVDHSSHVPGMRPPIGRGGYRGRGGGGRGRGTFGGEVHNFRPEQRNDKTLVVEKIPEDKLSLENVNSWFKRFGTVTNVAIDAHNAKALVSFSNHDEAHAAWKSEDAVFGNRFVKVFWHRPMEGHGQVGARMLAASAPLVANMSGTSESTPPPSGGASATPTHAAATPAPAPTPVQRKPSGVPTSSSTMTLLAAKSQLLEQTIAEQKKLMAALATASSAEEKKEIMAQFRKLDEEMSKLKESTPTPAAVSATAATAKPAGKKPTVDGLTEVERKERERLDKELEIHGGEKAGEDTEDLQAKLQRLKEEAASLGLESALPSTSYRGGYRGRARGGPRGYSRGGFMRGGPPRASMKLDNRPKKLLVKGVTEDNSQALRDWYETTGQLESLEPSDNGAYIVSFKSRSAAELGLAKGSNIPIVGSVQVSWYTGSTTHTTSNPTRTSSGDMRSSTKSNGHEHEHEAPRSPDTHVSHLPEEEIVASGWGGGDDEEDGMGLL